MNKLSRLHITSRNNKRMLHKAKMSLCMSDNLHEHAQVIPSILMLLHINGTQKLEILTFTASLGCYLIYVQNLIVSGHLSTPEVWIMRAGGRACESSTHLTHAVVSQLDVAVTVQQHIVQLQVTVHDACHTTMSHNHSFTSLVEESPWLHALTNWLYMIFFSISCCDILAGSGKHNT